MIVGVGVDLVSTERVERAIGTDGVLRDIAFTANEWAACAARADRADALAARFAAKEAFFKALGTGWGDGYTLKQVEVATGEHGRPELRLSGRAAARAADLGVRAIHVSLSHDGGSAAAVVVLEA